MRRGSRPAGLCGEGIYPRSAAQQSQAFTLNLELLGLLRNPTGINPLTTKARSHRCTYIGPWSLSFAITGARPYLAALERE